MHLQSVDAEAHVQKLAERYRHLHTETDRVVSQWCQSQLMFSELQTLTSLTVTEAYTRMPADFSDLRLMYKIALTLSVTTTGVKSGFSKLSYIKNKLRMAWLESLLLASAENDVLVNLSVDDLVSKFASRVDCELALG